MQRRPVGIMAFDRPEIGPLDFQTPAEIEIVRLDNSRFRIFKRPDHAGKHGGGDLHSVSEKATGKCSVSSGQKASSSSAMPCIERREATHGQRQAGEVQVRRQQDEDHRLQRLQHGEGEIGEALLRTSCTRMTARDLPGEGHDGGDLAEDGGGLRDGPDETAPRAEADPLHLQHEDAGLRMKAATR